MNIHNIHVTTIQVTYRGLSMFVSNLHYLKYVQCIKCVCVLLGVCCDFTSKFLIIIYYQLFIFMLSAWVD